jgi:CBS-domain-containing membrane protein
MKLPYLYEKLARLMDSEANSRNVARRSEIMERTPATYRISREDMPTLLRELEEMRAIRRQSRQLIDVRTRARV